MPLSIEMSPERGASSNPRSQRRSRLADRCRTCSSCRQKKVKCDSQRPKCASCQAKDIACEYPQDARRTVVRTRKEDVAALQKQVEELKEQMLSQSQQSPSSRPGSSAVAEYDPEKGLDFPGLADQYSQATLTPSNACLAPDAVSQTSRDTHMSPFQGSRCSNSSSRPAENHLALADSAPGMLGHGTKTLDLDSDEDSPEVYGATSLLHDKSSTAEPARQYSLPRHDACSIEIARDRLIAYAAIHRQEEMALQSSPSLWANIDFDGLAMETAMHLLNLHWNRQHLSYLLTYRPAIMDSLINNGPYVNKLLLNAIYLQSSLYSDRLSLCSDPQNPATGGTVFYDRFKSLLADYIDKPTLPTIVALLTCGACLVPRGKQSAGWVYCGMAYRMMSDLGYNLNLEVTGATERGSGLSAVEIEMRRRVYWAAYVNDKFQSLFLGRPPEISEIAGNVPQQYLDSYEEKELWTPYVDPLAGLTADSPPANHSGLSYPGRPTYALSTFNCLLQLCRIAARIIESFYSLQSAEVPETSLLQTRDEIRIQLSSWKDAIPSWLQFDPDVNSVPPPHQITPHTTYWSLVILTEQVFLSRGRFDSMALEAQEEGRQKCIDAAIQIWKLVKAYRNTFSLRRAQYGISYATYCAVLVLLQHTSQDTSTYIECIRFFWLALLEYQRGCNYGLKRPLRLLKLLMQRLETVNKNLEVDTEASAGPDTDALQAEMDILLGSHAMNMQDFDCWNGPWLGDMTQDYTIFGIADDSLLGANMNCL